MPQITLEEFLNGPEAYIQCDTEEQANAYCNAMHELGKKWRGGESFAEETFYIGNTIWYKNTMQYSTEGSHGATCYHFTDVVDFAQTSEPNPNQFRVLLRDYRWHNASWNEDSNKLSIVGKNIRRADIVSVENDPRAKYVVCKACGAVIKNTKKAIETHAQLGTTSKSCLTCKSLRLKDVKDLKESFAKNEDGTYTQNRKSVCTLVCDYSYSCPQIDSDKARSVCKYRKCSAESIEPADNFFTKYTGAFDDVATVDALDMTKWKVSYKHSNDSVDFKVNGRYNITAKTTNLGIIDRFVCAYRSNVYEVVYSKKYDKMFLLECGEYVELKSTSSRFSETYYNELMKMMRNIYKGEN